MKIYRERHYHPVLWVNGLRIVKTEAYARPAQALARAEKLRDRCPWHPQDHILVSWTARLIRLPAGKK